MDNLLPMEGLDSYPMFDNTKPSMAVIAYDGDNGTVIWHVGACLYFEIEESGMRDIGDLGLEPPAAGIWIWEGRYVWSRGSYECPEDGTSDPVGEFRAPTDAEWQAIREGHAPWNADDWKKLDKKE